MSSYRPNYTAVVIGRKPGIYASYEEALKQVDGYPGALFRGFSEHSDAAGWLRFESRKQGVKAEPTSRPTKKKAKLGPSRSLVTLSDDEEEPVMTNGRWTRSRSAEARDDVSAKVELAERYTKAQFVPQPVIKKSSRSSSPEVQVEAQPADEPPPLSPQQQEVLDRILQGENIFFTGAAGTGKSHLFRAIIKALRSSKGGAKQVAVTASTGMAALNVGGVTLHSWARIGLGNKPVDALVRQILKNKVSTDAWRRTDVLLVDEISMISGELLDKLDKIGREVRRRHSTPFGGLQVIFCGDFFQLPPVSDRNNGVKVQYAFDSDVWDRAFPRSNRVTLQQVFRQSEQNLVTALEHIRRGRMTPEAGELLNRCNRPVACPEGTQPVQLYSRRYQVEQVNNQNLFALPGESKVFKAIDIGGKTTSNYEVSQEQATKTLNSHTRWPESIALKVGAQVMLVHNWQPGLVNGSTGKVIGFSTMADFGLDEEGEKKTPPKVDGDTEGADRGPLWPVVDFEARNGLKRPPVLVPNLEVTVENARGGMEARRIQVPLILAWAITIHKAQGMTLTRVKVDLNGTFDDGQAYVALSRATSLDGLELRGFSLKHIMVSKRVLEWAEEADEDDDFDAFFAANADEIDALTSSQPALVGMA